MPRENMTEPNAEIIEEMVRHCLRLNIEPRSLTNFCFRHCAPFAERNEDCKSCFVILEAEYVAAEAQLPTRRTAETDQAAAERAALAREVKAARQREEDRYYRRSP